MAKSPAAFTLKHTASRQSNIRVRVHKDLHVEQSPIVIVVKNEYALDQYNIDGRILAANTCILVQFPIKP
jgi:hypothetical protein